MKNARLDEAQAGIKIAKRSINNLRYTYTRLKRLSTLSLAVPFLSVIVIEVCTFFLFYGEVTHVG